MTNGFSQLLRIIGDSALTCRGVGAGVVPPSSTSTSILSYLVELAINPLRDGIYLPGPHSAPRPGPHSEPRREIHLGLL